MIRTITLHGALAEQFGTVFKMDVKTPAEAVRALCTMLDGFQIYIDDKYYQLFRGAEIDGRDQDPQELHIQFSDDDKELHIVPRSEGAKKGGIGKIILGAILVIVSFFIPAVWAIAGKSIAGMVASAGVAMALGGLAQVFASPNQGVDYNATENQTGSLFNGSLNSVQPGAAVPVLIGESEVGSVVASAAIHLEDRIIVA